MKKYFCVNCGYIYDELAGDPERGIARCMLVSMLPDDWRCPDCGGGAELLSVWRIFNYTTQEMDNWED